MDPEEVVKSPDVTKTSPEDAGVKTDIIPKVGSLPPTPTPKANCKKCYGTGRIGFVLDEKKRRVPVLCRCMKSK